MYKYLILLFALLIPVYFYAHKENESSNNKVATIISESTENNCQNIYQKLGLNTLVNYNAFKQAYEGYQKISSQKHILTLIDFTKPSTEERMYVIDMNAKQLLHKTHVSHGQNSGGNYATKFSNKSGSHQSSLGFYLTEDTYLGRNGLSLVLNGLDKGINDKAKERAIVVHGAAYSNPSSIKSMGRLGRSHGCPALPEAVSKEIINTIKGGSVLFIYAADKNYANQSTVLSSINNKYIVRK